jgi:hypothetical protein
MKANCKICKVKFEQKKFNVRYCLQTDECIKAFSNWVKEQKEKQYNKAKISLDSYEKEHNDEKNLKASKINTKMQVHAFVHQRDKGKECVSCGKPYEISFEAGHHYSAYSYLTLKFNLDNIHGQCKYCNRYLESNFDNYALRLPKRIGQERYNELVRLAGIDKQFEKVWNLENLKEIRDNIKQLKKEL